MTIRQVEATFCDLCDKMLKEQGCELFKATTEDPEKHICGDCYERVYFEYMRIFKKQVPDRRGGWRSLGEYDS